MDQWKLEKYTEWITARLERRVDHGERDSCPVLDEMREILILIKETNMDAMDFEMGLPRNDVCDKCSEGCYRPKKNV